ncbi:hypothetical protein [Maridesulfovibrio frigidus]|uniref:hypothetical protein n=1 Tax=Maridesulfovibrio frigidus TaxID=340956 RepID=UPI0004E15190|nr:hypothetical protein [Maridesulfovibrio frigidus]
MKNILKLLLLSLILLQGCGIVARQQRTNAIKDLKPGMDYDQVVSMMQYTSFGYEVDEAGHNIRVLPLDRTPNGSTWLGLCFEGGKLVSWKDDLYVKGSIFGARVANPEAACRGHVAGSESSIILDEAASSVPVWYSPSGRREIILTHGEKDFVGGEMLHK